MTDDKWKKLKEWVGEQMIDRYYDNDAYRYTAYEAVYNEMKKLEEGENKSLVEYLNK